MGKIPEGAPIAWVLGPDQKFVEVRPPRQPCPKCGGFHPVDDDDDDETEGDEDGRMVLKRDDRFGTHRCVVCGDPITSEDVTLVLTRWQRLPHQKQRYPLVGGNRLAHVSCCVMDTLDFRKMQDQKVRALQQVDKRLSSKVWHRSRKKFQSLLMEETQKLLREEEELNAERHRLLRSFDRVEKLLRKGE